DLAGDGGLQGRLGRQRVQSQHFEELPTVLVAAGEPVVEGLDLRERLSGERSRLVGEVLGDHGGAGLRCRCYGGVCSGLGGGEVGGLSNCTCPQARQDEECTSGLHVEFSAPLECFVEDESSRISKASSATEHKAARGDAVSEYTLRDERTKR